MLLSRISGDPTVGGLRGESSTRMGDLLGSPAQLVVGTTSNGYLSS